MPLTLPRRALLAGAVAAACPARAATETVIGYLGRPDQPRPPTTFLEPQAEDAGLQGARLGIADGNANGRFTGQAFRLHEIVLDEDPDEAVLAAFAAAGARALILDLDAETLDRLLRRAPPGGPLLFNARAQDDELRHRHCRPDLLHTAPSRRMLADALAQYLLARRWDKWMLLAGATPPDQAYAAAIRRAAARFGGRIVAERQWTLDTANRRSDSGHTTLQGEIPAATQGPEHHVLIVADEADRFGEYLPDRTYQPRPVAGTHGLVPTSWSRVHEQWGATQLHNRFQRAAGRWMQPRDYDAWVAARAIAEAALRAEPDQAGSFLRSADCRLGVFKGQTVSFRAWDGQLRQPILIAGPRMLVSVSPQPGFLHERSVLDTLGDDRSDSPCRTPS
jgi:hypothetical protein